MKPTLSRVFTLLATAGLACGDSSTTGPDETGTIPGVSLSAEVSIIAAGGAFAPGMILSLQVHITNTTNAPVQLHYPAGCPVRARLYQSGSDRLLYDQTATFACDFDVTVPLNIAAGATANLSSGTGFPNTIEADTVPAGFYRATAVLRITGQNPIELEAGTYRLPHCIDPSEPRTCTYNGPPATIDTRHKQ